MKINHLFDDYLKFVQYVEEESCIKNMEAQMLNPGILDDNRILHYKMDILLSLLLHIQQKTEIPFDAFTAFLDFHFIETSLIHFSLYERFQIFEIVLKTYITSLKNIDERTFLYAYEIKNLSQVLHKNFFKTLEGQKEYQFRKEQLPFLENIFSKKELSFQSAKNTLIQLGINEHFAHFFLLYMQEKYQKRAIIAKNLIDYYFTGNTQYVYQEKDNKEVGKELEKNYFENTRSNSFNEDESKQLHYYLLNLLEENYGNYFIGFYSCIYSEMKYIKENDSTIYAILLKALLNDLIYLKRKKTIYDISTYKDVENTLARNFSLLSFKQPNQEEVKQALQKLDIPSSFLDFFVQKLVSSYESFMNVKRIPVYKKEKKSIVLENKETIDPFVETELNEKRIEEVLLTLLSTEEKEKYFQALHYSSLNHSGIKGYCEQLNLCISSLKDIAEGVLNEPLEKDLYLALLQDEINKIDEIFYQINMVIPYKLVQKN